MQPFRMSALELISAYRTRKLSPVEAMASVIERVEAFEPHIHATWLYAPERALKEARASEARWARAEPIGPLDGVPATVKDNIATKGEPKPVGTAAEDLSPQKADAPPAQRLREAGAIIFTKTTMPDYGMLTSGLSSFHPLARNPWNLDRNPGGSSAGAGAAAAALYGPLHLGTDIGGSVRLPAGFCGIFGLKPSGGRIPIDPPYTGRVAGPMTRDVDDAALMMATLSLPDVRDYASLKYEKLNWIVEPAQLKGLRVGLLLEAGCGAPPTPDEPGDYVQTARPGHRAPHAWLADGRSTIDLFGDGFTLLRLGFAGDVTPLTAAAADRGVPLRVIALDDPAIARLYERQLVLVRPDGMVAWRADSLPDDVSALLSTVTGNVAVETAGAKSADGEPVDGGRLRPSRLTE